MLQEKLYRPEKPDAQLTPLRVFSEQQDVVDYIYKYFLNRKDDFFVDALHLIS